MGAVGIGLAVVGAAVVGWVVAPVVSMARRGTIDQRTVAAWRSEEPTDESQAPEDPQIPRPRNPSALPRRRMA